MNKKEKLGFWIIWTFFVWFLAICIADITRGSTLYNLRCEFNDLKNNFIILQNRNYADRLKYQENEQLRLQKIIKLEKSCG